MGYAKWSTQDYHPLRSRYAHQSRDDIFRNNRLGRIAEAMNPYGLGIRESRDSQQHPNSLAIGIFLDVTGSMGRIPELLIRQKLGTLMDTMLDHGVADPQVMFSAIGDQFTDLAPLQVGQFESGANEMNHGLSQIFLEGGGGGQARESYQLAWLIAGRHTSIDCFEKRGQKGFLFTVGDEMSWDQLDGPYLQQLMGYSEAYHISSRDLLTEAQEKYHVYHIHINETGYKNNPQVMNYWQSLLGEQFIVLENHLALAELIASIVAMVQGVDPQSFTSNFDTQTTRLIERSLQGLRTRTQRLAQQTFKGWF
ncbi:MAG: hypothetical protein AAF705_09535 [Bacteroidota bacterium]